MRNSKLEIHRKETLNYLRAMKQKIKEEQAEEALRRTPQVTKRRGFISAVKEFALPRYDKTRIYQ